MPAVDRYAEICAAHRWDVPADFNIAEACCGRWAADRTRFALYWEDEDGRTRGADVLGPAAAGESAVECADGARRRARRPGRADPAAAPRDGVAHIACYQLGAVAMPLSFLFGPEALEYRLQQPRGEGRVRRSAVAAQSRSRSATRCPASAARRRRRRRDREPGIDSWESLLENGVAAVHARRPRARRSRAADLHQRHDRPAEGRADAAQCLLGNLPGFVALAQRVPAAGRPVLVAGRLGVDRRPDGRAAADALLRPADRRLSRPLRPRARVRADASDTGSATRSCSRPR